MAGSSHRARVYSFDDFLRDKETIWDGVTTNPTAVKHLREMNGHKVDLLPTPARAHAGAPGRVSVDAPIPKVPIVPRQSGQVASSIPKTLAEIKAEPIFAKSAGSHRPFP